MEPDERFTRDVPGSPNEKLEVGVATWDKGNGTSLSVRHYVLNEGGGFDPHSSGEIPVELMGQMVDLVREYLQHR